MAWHDETPWRSKRKREPVTVTEKLAQVERHVRYGDMGIHEALIAAYTIGIEAGRANPAVQRIGDTHDTEVKS